MIQNIGWKNGEWLDINKLNIACCDRGLKFSDGIFETILIRNNKAILLKEHLKRFYETAKLLNFSVSIENNIIQNILKEGIRKLSLNNNQYGSIRINYSRGLNKGRGLKIYDDYNKFNINNLWIEFYTIDLNLKPISVHISETEKRNEHSLLSKCKTFSYIQSIQCLNEATLKNFDDSLLLNTNNELCCGSTFNLILRRNNHWITPRKESGCLPGIMINQLIKLNLVKEEYIEPFFKEDDVLIAINSLFCKQIIKVNDLNFSKTFDTLYFWEILYI